MTSLAIQYGIFYSLSLFLLLSVSYTDCNIAFKAQFVLMLMDDSSLTTRYHRIKVKRPIVTITEHDVDDMLKSLRRQKASWSQVKRGALPGDRITAKYTGWIHENKVIDSGDEPCFFILGSSQPPKKVQKALIGAKPGDFVYVNVKPLTTDGNGEFEDKKIKYEYQIISVCEQSIPDLDKAFARSFGVRDGSLKKLRKQVNDILHHQIDNLVRRNVRQQLIDGLLDVHLETTVSGQENRETKARVSNKRSSKNKLATARFSNACNTTTQDDRQHALSQIAMSIIRENSIAVDQNKVEAAITAIAATSDNPEATITQYRNDHELFSKVEASVLENQLLDFVLEHAKVKDIRVNYRKLCREFRNYGQEHAAIIQSKIVELPIIELSSDKKCGYCVRSCCTYITQKIPTPRTKEDFSHLLWQVSHHQVEVYKDNEGWHLMFTSHCEHLMPNGRCSNYEHRMHVCRKHSNAYCEFDAPADDGFELNFKDYASLLTYCKQRFPRWKY